MHSLDINHSIAFNRVMGARGSLRQNVKRTVTDQQIALKCNILLIYPPYCALYLIGFIWLFLLSPRNYSSIRAFANKGFFV